jgi:DNA end-binding protein Ku
VRKAEDYFGDIPDIKIAPDMLKLAQHIVERKRASSRRKTFVDHYEEAVVEIIRKKQAHIPLKKSSEKAAAPKNVINLMDALRRSVQTTGAKPAKAAKGKKKAAAGQREMLLPISGKKGKDAAKEVAKAAPRRKAG